MLLDVPPRRLLGRFIPEPLPPAGTFDGKTVLIVGATAGLGFAAAVHFFRLGASVIITCRSESRGEDAKRRIREIAGTDHKGKLSSLLLDMSRYESCVNFIDSLKTHLTNPEALDVAVLNAGVINPHFETSPEGWEQTIQVNTLSTTLVGFLLLGWMKEGRERRESPAHIVFVTSRDHLYPDIKDWAKWAKEEGGILGHICNQGNWPGWWKTTEPNYGESKLLVTYAIEEITKEALGPDGVPQVVVNSICPGVVRSDIGRTLESNSWLMKLLVPAYLMVLGKSPDYGARFYVNAALKPSESHGEFSNGWLTAEQYRRKAIPSITSKAGREVQALVWKEISTELTSKVPRLEAQLRRSSE